MANILVNRTRDKASKVAFFGAQSTVTQRYGIISLELIQMIDAFFLTAQWSAL